VDKKVNNRHFNKRFLFYLSLSLIFIFTSVIYEFRIDRKSAPEKILNSLQADFNDAEKSLSVFLDSLARKKYLQNTEFADTFIREKISDRFSYTFLVYKNDSLKYWSNNSLPITQLSKTYNNNGLTVSLENGFYYCRDTVIGDYRLSGIFLIKRNYPYQNIYLENRFQSGFSAPPETKVLLTEGDLNVYSGNHFAFSILPDEGHGPGMLPSLLLLALYAFAFLAFNAAIFQLYMRYGSFLKSKLLIVIAFAIDVIIFRVLIFVFEIPYSIHSTYIFEPGSFAASDFFPSMGDFLFNALTILIICYTLFITYRNIRLKRNRPAFRRYFLVFSLFLHIFIFYRLFLWAANSLIMDASYSLNLNQIYFLTADSLLAIIVFTVLLFSFFLISYRILGLAFHYAKHSILQYFGFLLLTSLIYFLICVFIHGCDFLLFIPLFIYAIAFFFQASSRPDLNKVGFSGVVLYLFLFAILGTAVLSSFNAIREVEQRKLLAVELASGEDPLTEYIFLSAVEEMWADTNLLKLLSGAPYSITGEDQAISYIEDNYLADRLRKYEWMVTICTPDRDLSIQPEDFVVNCYDYFDTIIDRIGQPALGNGQYRYENEAGMHNYISARDYFLNDASDTLTVFIELTSFFIPEKGLGYPELLIEEQIKTSSSLENYSYARYKDNILVFKYGDYPYRTNIQKYGELKAGTFFNHNNSDHYISRIDENEILMISKAETTFLEVLAPFSYLLIFFTLFVLLFISAVSIPFMHIGFELNFRNQLQLYIISLIITAFVFVGIITVNYVINLNTNKNKEILQEKTHSVLIELEHKLSGEVQLTADIEEYLTSLLIKFSQVFFSDINLYDLQGSLLASSRQQIFQKQLISTKMNADAYRILTLDKKLLYIHTETIGDQDYFSAYVPFMNEENRVVAYLNLPYFARQTELQNEVSVFLNAFLNVYVLMIAVAIFLAILISRYITQPLQLIRDKMGSLSLGGRNEKIKWSRKDEIGTLVSEYNRMIDELSRSAELLAKSERESAWREMAKQVAHEIKNPLTPMKLSVQYLQKAWDEKSTDWEERLQRFTQTIIEHIDTLSAIASEFSDFAKMPQKKEVRVDLSEAIIKSLDLFSDMENIHFSFNANPEPPHYILADKNQLIRVFNNLIQNSVQAIGHSKHGEISITLDLDNDNYLIRVSDNGPGISEDMVDKIFSPSFTTKSSGMGLGLALVRSIVVEAGGNISFESSSGAGTEFLIRLPVYQSP